MPALAMAFCCWEIFVSALFSQLVFFAIPILRAPEIHFDNDMIYHQRGEVVQ
jgi:hypothetical protein